MTKRLQIALVGGVATILASSVLSTVFRLFTWFMYAAVAVAVVVGVSIVVRGLRAPVLAQAGAMVVALGAFLTWVFPSGEELAGIIPTGRTVEHFRDLLTSAGSDIREQSIPVEDRPGLIFLAVLGIGAVAIAVDVLAVGMSRPALAGLPMLAIYSVPVAVNRGSVSWLPFALGVVGYLWLLVTDNIDRVRRWGRRFTGDGRDIDAWEPSPLAASSRRIGLAGLVLAIVVPLLVPGMTAGLFERFATVGNGTGTGNGPGRPGGGINPIATLRGNLIQDKQFEMLRVRTDDTAPRYMRMAVADQVGANGFTPRPPQGRQPLSDGLPQSVVPPSVASETWQANVEVISLNDRYLPVYEHPSDVDVRGRWYFDNATGVVYANRPSTRDLKYRITYTKYDFTAEELRSAPVIDENDPVRALYTEVPHIAYVQNLVGQVVADQRNEYDRTLAILDYFKPANGFVYSLQTKAGTSGSAIVDFLRNKRGYCEQYAAAMTWMLREAGIPARVAIGFTQGSRERDHFTLTNRDVHAWVEAYFPDYGWVAFDPTPATGVSGSARFGWAPNPSQPTGDGTNGEDDAAPKPSGSAAAPGSGRSDDAPGNAANSSGNGGGGLPRWPFWTLGSLLLAVALVSPGAHRLALRRNRHRAGDHAGTLRPEVTEQVGVMQLEVDGEPATAGAARYAAHAAWDELLDTLVDYRLPVDSSETPRATAERLVARPRLVGAAAQSVRLLARAEEHARYAKQPLYESDLRAAVRRVRAGLAVHVPRQRRWAAALMPRSVVLRWRWRVGHTMITGINTLTRVRDGVLRRITPRRLLIGRFNR